MKTIQRTFLYVITVIYLQSLVQVSGKCADANPIFTNESTTAIEETKTNLYFPIIYTETDTWLFDVYQYDNTQPTGEVRNRLREYFTFNATINSTLSLELVKPLDKEALNVFLNRDVNSIRLKFTCRDQVPSVVAYEYLIRIIAVNEMPPLIYKAPFNVSIPESTKNGTEIFDLSPHVKDQDVPEDTPFNYKIVNHTIVQMDGKNYFDIDNYGRIRLKQMLDYDSLKPDFKYGIRLNISVEDSGQRGVSTVLTVNIKDVDDLPPLFNHNVFKASTYSSYRGILTLYPENITAIDQDSFLFPIRYSLATVSDYSDSFVINQTTGKIYQTGEIYKTVAITIKAEEVSTNKFHSIASLIVYAGNYSVVSGLTPSGKSPAAATGDDGSQFKTILVVVAVIAIIVISVLVIAFALYHRKQKKAIAPGEQPQSETSTDTEEIQSTKSMQWPPVKSESKQDLLGSSTNVAMLPTPEGKGNRLPPLPLKDSSTETETIVKKKRSRRRNKNKEPEIYDGTKEYEMEADPEFFDSTDKSKIKRSSRSKDTKTDPKYWITVQNDF